MMNPTDPAEAAEADGRATLHTPGAVRGWAPRAQVRLPADRDARLRWLADYAAALTRFTTEVTQS